MKSKILSVFLVYCLLVAVCAPGIYPEESGPEISTITEMISGNATVKEMEPFNYSKIISSGAIVSLGVREETASIIKITNSYPIIIHYLHSIICMIRETTLLFLNQISFILHLIPCIKCKIRNILQGELYAKLMKYILGNPAEMEQILEGRKAVPPPLPWVRS